MIDKKILADVSALFLNFYFTKITAVHKISLKVVTIVLVNALLHLVWIRFTATSSSSSSS